ncbi:hypothetical protein AV530_002386 [Patagioenas fasciata monilis]|uniref:Tubulin epsilon and delta complex protein 1 domain-containing protein n=1 Tax=Patagioenas fasciata monilis TaxID=372326 RepID=A0A1V4K662_PATFA|nr:hypothetical protein AV530_002386 [Patagioenas fasciata monilis]
MEVLYSALEGEISAFVGHVKRCQQGFDLRRLYHVLLLVLPWSPSGQVESWQHLQRLVQHQPSSASPDVASYVSWLASYLQHLSTLKERFDTRVVVPLCENLAPQQPSSPLGFPSLLVRPRPSGTGSTRLLQAQLRKSREELLALLHHGQRAATLHAQVHHVAQRIRILRLQQRGKGTELSQARQGPGMGPGSCWHQAVLAEELQKNLELEEYHHSILEADWLLELEVRPMLIRRTDVVRSAR